MGNIEQRSRVKERNSRIQKIILGTVATASLLAVTALAPGVVGAMAKFGLIPMRRHREVIKRSRQKLIERGLLELRGGFFKLTPKGEFILRSGELRGFRLKKPKHWDKRWRVLIFDIQEKRRYVRNKLRRTLAAIGFIRLQQSVWIYPYDCEDLITLLKADFKIGKEMLYMIVDELEFDLPIRKAFAL